MFAICLITIDLPTHGGQPVGLLVIPSYLIQIECERLHAGVLRVGCFQDTLLVLQVVLRAGTAAPFLDVPRGTGKHHEKRLPRKGL